MKINRGSYLSIDFNKVTLHELNRNHDVTVAYTVTGITIYNNSDYKGIIYNGTIWGPTEVSYQTSYGHLEIRVDMGR